MPGRKGQAMWMWRMLLCIACVASSVAFGATDLSEKKALLVIAPSDFQDQEYSETRSALEDEGVTVSVASSASGTVTGMLGATVSVDMSLSSASATDYDAVVFIGGSGVTTYWDDDTAQALATASMNASKVTGAICWAPVILSRAGLLNGKNATVAGDEQKLELETAGATVPDDAVVTDGLLVTADGPEAAAAFGQALVTVLKSLAEIETPTTINPMAMIPLATGNVWTYASNWGGCVTERVTLESSTGTYLFERVEEEEKEWLRVADMGVVSIAFEDTEEGVSTTYTPDTYILQFPNQLTLNQGVLDTATVTGTTGSTTETFSLQVTVLYTGTASVTTPVGTFDCYVIQRTENINNGQEVMVDTLYLADGVGVVKISSVETLSDGESETGTLTLMGGVIGGSSLVTSGATIAIGMPEDEYSATRNEATAYVSVYGSVVADVYLVLVLPDGAGFLSWTTSGFASGIQPFVSNWSTFSLGAYPAVSVELPALASGEYWWYAVLVNAGENPLDSATWLAVATDSWWYED